MPWVVVNGQTVHSEDVEGLDTEALARVGKEPRRLGQPFTTQGEGDPVPRFAVIGRRGFGGWARRRW